jgi:hypothetical protein
MATAGNNNLQFFSGEPILMLGPEHAASIAEAGFSKDKIKDYIFEHARLPVEKLSEGHIKYREKFPNRYGDFVKSEMIPIAKRDDIVVMVAGGAGKHSCFIPTFGLNRSVTRGIRF